MEQLAHISHVGVQWSYEELWSSWGKGKQLTEWPLGSSVDNAPQTTACFDARCSDVSAGL